MAKRVLVVDDDSEVRDMISEFFEGQGFGVLRATNGLEALLHVKRERPDGVILDIQMPRLGGLEALKRIRAFDPAINTVVVSGAVNLEIRQQALAAGASGVFEKPVVLRDLLSVISPGTPPQPARARGAATPVEDAAPVGASAGTVTQILVVDDDPEILSLLQEFLDMKGYGVRGATDGAHAMREIIKAPPDVILLDIAMPGLTGVDALPALRALAPRAAVIMVSGSTDVEVSKLALVLGAFDYVTKPIDLAYLTQSIETIVAMRGLEE